MFNKFTTFREFLAESRRSPEHSSHTTINQDDTIELLYEKIIIPKFEPDEELTLDINILNSMDYFKNLDIKFTNTDDSTYHPKEGIKIGMNLITNLIQLKSSIKHEIIHAMQFERSQSKYLNYAKSLEKNFKKAVTSGKFKSKEEFYSEYENIKYQIEFDNPYEK